MSCVLTSISQSALIAANVHAQATAVLLFETRKLTYKTFSRTVVITPVNETKHHFPCHRKFMKHRVKRDLG